MSRLHPISPRTWRMSSAIEEQRPTRRAGAQCPRASSHPRTRLSRSSLLGETVRECAGGARRQPLAGGGVRVAIAARRRELPVVLDLDQDGAEAWRLTAVATPTW